MRWARKMGEQRRGGYATDVTDGQWRELEPLLRPATGGRGPGRPPVVDLRRVVDALFYQNRTGCQWRMLPRDFPAWGAVRSYFDKWQQDGTWERVNDALRRAARWEAGREPEPTAGIIDSQTAKTTEVGGDHGYDGGKKGQRSQATHRRGHRREPVAGVGLDRQAVGS